MRWMPVSFLAAPLVAVALVAGCSGDDSDDSVATPVEREAPAPRTENAESAGVCLDVPFPIQREIRSGLVEGVTASGFQAVRSEDFDAVWLVSGLIEVEGAPGAETATWSTNDFSETPEFSGTVFTINETARRFSDHPPSAAVIGDLRMVADASRGCVSE